VCFKLEASALLDCIDGDIKKCYQIDFEGAWGSEYYGKIVTNKYDPEKKLFVLSRTPEKIDTIYDDDTYDCKFIEILEDSSAWKVAVSHASKDLEKHQHAVVRRSQIRETD
jgi:hypothetical protein